jgi:hypothetical protein
VLVAGLRAAATPWTVLAADFLTLPAVPVYDRVLMNPPFEKGQDLAHVMRACLWLQPGGRLVSVMAASVTFNSCRAHREFRDFVAELDGTIEPLPDDAFAAAGTGVRTVVVTLRAPTE